MNNETNYSGTHFVDAIAHWICTLSDMSTTGDHVDLILTSGTHIFIRCEEAEL